MINSHDTELKFNVIRKAHRGTTVSSVHDAIYFARLLLTFCGLGLHHGSRSSLMGFCSLLGLVPRGPAVVIRGFAGCLALLGIKFRARLLFSKKKKNTLR